jgi:dihydropteroate synthase
MVDRKLLLSRATWPIFNFKNNESRLMYTLNCRGRLMVIDRPVVMGIINTTPDSFYPGSRFTGTDAVLDKTEKMLSEGAAIIDLGGQSTRPGSEKLTPTEELQRVVPAVEAISKRFPDAIVSIDTFYSGVAREAVAAGASIINDISGGSIDAEMVGVAASLKVPYVLMHIKGTPQMMNQSAQYIDVTKEVLDYFIARVAELKSAGVTDIIVDPGFGFAKNSGHNFQLLKNLEVFKMLERPILLGVSRKSTIYKTLGVTAEEALNGTTVLHTIGLMNGASILRAHDVKEAREAIQLVNAMKG